MLGSNTVAGSPRDLAAAAYDLQFDLQFEIQKWEYDLHREGRSIRDKPSVISSTHRNQLPSFAQFSFDSLKLKKKH